MKKRLKFRFRKRRKGENPKTYLKMWRAAYQIVRRKTKEGKASVRKWNLSQGGKATHKRYEDSRKGKAKHKRYYHSPKGQITRKRYYSTPEFKSTVKQHNNSPGGKLRLRLVNRIIAALRRAGAKRSAPIMTLLGVNFAKVVSHIESLWDNKMSWKNYGAGKGKWNIDHVTAISLFDLTNPRDQRMAFSVFNLQPLWHEDHVIKSREDRDRTLSIPEKVS